MRRGVRLLTAGVLALGLGAWGTTVAQAAPPASFDSERVWSTSDDWEPVVAADASSSFVYQLTTRIDGARACQNCPYSPIMFRASSDGGATWGSDQYLG